MITIKQIEPINNFFQLKKIAVDNNIKISEGDKVKEIKQKIIDSINLQAIKIRSFTYKGSGATPPHKIKFMGKVDFIRGQVTDIIDNKQNDLILFKLQNHPCFVEGSIDEMEMIKADAKEQERADRIKKEDMQIDANLKRKHG